MSQIDLIDNKWSDLMFENRNKEYGAYVLRRQTGRRNVAAILAVLLLFACVMVYMVAKNAYDEYQKTHQIHDQVTELTTLKQEKKKEAKVERKEIVKQQEVEKVVEKVKSSVKFTAPVIKKDDEVKPEEELKTQDELMSTKTAIGTFDVKGNDDANGEILKAKDVIAEPEPPKHEEENKVFDIVEQQPLFPGGPTALMKYLSENTKYPVVAQENGVQGRVTVQFVVEKDGSISDVHVLRGVDPSLDKEAVRVVKSMPRWTPGKQNGITVRVNYRVPVLFRLQ